MRWLGRLLAPLSLFAALLLTGCGGGGGGSAPDNSGGGGGTSPPAGSGYARSLALGLGSGASFDVDAQGVFQVAYIDPVSGALKFARCASACDQSTNWKTVLLSGLGVVGGSPVLQLDSAGNPRIVWPLFAGIAAEGDIVYLECSTACGDSVSNWKSLRVATLTSKSYQYVAAHNPSFFALDRQGKATIAYHSTGAPRLATCAAQCLQLASWQVTGLSAAQTGSFMLHASVAATAAGLPRVAATLADATGRVALHYFDCTSACTLTANWRDTTVVGVGTWLRLRLDGADNPRLLYFAGPLTNNPDSNKLFYSACDAGCTQAASWRRAAVSVADKSGATGLDMVLSTAGVPTIAYDTPTSQQLALARCSGDCAAAGTWTTTVVDDAISQAADASLRSFYKASYCRYGLGFIDPLLEPLFSLSIFVGQQAHLALSPSGRIYLTGDFSATVNCGNGVATPAVSIPALYSPP